MKKVLLAITITLLLIGIASAQYERNFEQHYFNNPYATYAFPYSQWSNYYQPIFNNQYWQPYQSWGNWGWQYWW